DTMVNKAKKILDERFYTVHNKRNKKDVLNITTEKYSKANDVKGEAAVLIFCEGVSSKGHPNTYRNSIPGGANKFGIYLLSGVIPNTDDYDDSKLMGENGNKELKDIITICNLKLVKESERDGYYLKQENFNE